MNDKPNFGLPATMVMPQETALDAMKLTGDERILWGVVANAGRLAHVQRPRWAAVKDATGLGSTAARELCTRFKFDPEEQVGQPEEETDEEDGPSEPFLRVYNEETDQWENG